MNTQETEFSSLVLDPDSWIRQSEQFFLAAKALYQMIERQPPITTETTRLTVGALKATLLLLGISVENALKAVRAKRGEIKILNGKVKTDSFGGGKHGHDLLKLAGSIGLDLKPGEKDILEQLTKIVVWAGKYQQPLDANQFWQAKSDDPRRLTFRDIDLVDGIIKKAYEMVSQSANH